MIRNCDVSQSLGLQCIFCAGKFLFPMRASCMILLSFDVLCQCVVLEYSDSDQLFSVVFLIEKVSWQYRLYFIFSRVYSCLCTILQSEGWYRVILKYYKYTNDSLHLLLHYRHNAFTRYYIYPLIYYDFWNSSVVCLNELILTFPYLSLCTGKYHIKVPKRNQETKSME